MPAREGPSRERLRFLISLTVAGGLGLAWWLTSPSHLSGHINIVGYATFSDFAFQRSLLAYRLVVWEFPIVSALVYALLHWRGPLRNLTPPSHERIDMVAQTAAEQAAGEPIHLTARPLLQLVPPAILVALSVSSSPPTMGDHVTRISILAAVAYMLAVMISSALVAMLMRRRSLARFTQRGEALSLVNGFAGAAVSVGALVYVSRHTLILTPNSEPRYWPWFPVWFAIATLLAVMIWMIWRLGGGWAPSRVERRVRTVLTGSVAMFLLTATIPGGIPAFSGFDDAQSVVGADLMTRGYFPWRDFTFIHGLFEDALRSSIGLGMFEHSIWGALAGTTLILVPLCWVGYYLLSVWADRSRSLILLLTFAVAAWGGITVWPRFVAVPLIFILLGEALRRRRPFMTVLFTVAMFIEAVLVPEMSLQVIAAGITIIASDIVRRDPKCSWWFTLQHTRYFIATGASLSVLLSAFLALNHALVPFLGYYTMAGLGHTAAGAIPPSLSTKTAGFLFITSIVLVALTTWMVAWRLLGRRSWTARDWITMSAAILTGLYAEKAVGRFDEAHVEQTISVALPLWIMWVTSALGASDDFLRAQLDRVRPLRATRGLLRQPVTVSALVLTLVLVPSVPQTIWNMPGNTKQSVRSVANTPLVGYQDPGAIDPLLLADLRNVVNTYAGKDGEILDNTNSPGYFYYLLQRAPASTFIHVSLAEPEFVQQLLLDQLAKSRPALVAFDSNTIGLPAWEWDGPRNNIRHFKIAQYLLNGWTPILRTHSVLFMLRNDLVAKMPSVPMLTSPPETLNLAFSSPTCAWGDVANFLESQPAPPALSLPVAFLRDISRLEVRGWSYDEKAHVAPSRIVITIGNTVVADAGESVSRPDVAAYFKDPAAATSGFDVSVLMTSHGTLGVYAQGADGTLHPVGTTPKPPTGFVQMPNGTRLIVTTPILGSIERSAWSVSHLLSISVPVSADLTSFALATFMAPATIGAAQLTLTDQRLQNRNRAGAVGPQVLLDNHEITANVLPIAGSSLAVRVGSCLQWHGYKTRTLHLLQTGGVLITRLRLSGVPN